MSNYEIADFQALDGVPCPCGTAKRAFADTPDYPLTVHLTEITEDARPHYHNRLTETYYIIDCDPDTKMQLDDELIDVHPGMCVLIRPGTVHRSVGRMTILNIVTPKFDPADEVLVDQ